MSKFHKPEDEALYKELTEFLRKAEGGETPLAVPYVMTGKDHDLDREKTLALSCYEGFVPSVFAK